MLNRFRCYLSELRLYVANHIVANVPLHWVRRLYYLYCMRFTLSKTATINLGVRFYCAGGFEMKENATVNENCSIDNRGRVCLGENSALASGVTILTTDHDPRNTAFFARSRGVVIDCHAFVCTGATILPGVTVGKGSMIGACSVVTKNVPPYAIVAGNPARTIGYRPENLSYNTYYRRMFH